MGGSTARRNSSKSSGGSYGGGERDRKQQQQVVDKVAVTKAADTAKKKEIASGNNMYGGAVSKAINEKLVERGYGKKTGGDGTMLSPEGYKMKYGQYTPGQAQDGVAMGTGNSKGVLTSTAISKEMLRSQNKAKAIMTGALSFGMPGIGATAMRISAAESAADYANPEAAYEDYMDGFEAKMQGKKYTKKRSAQSFAGKVIENIKTTILGGDGSKLGD